MNTKIFYYIVTIYMAMSMASGIAGATDNSQEQKNKIHAERLHLESEKKSALKSCEQYLNSTSDNYNKCTSVITSQFTREIQYLMREPDGYFAWKINKKK